VERGLGWVGTEERISIKIGFGMSAESGKKNEVWKKGLPGESGVQCYPDLTLFISYRLYKQKV
jgi:hypothetical protein